MDQLYDVVVSNDLTDEMTTVSLRSTGETDAQVEALVSLFRSRGWRKARTVRVERPDASLPYE